MCRPANVEKMGEPTKLEKMCRHTNVDKMGRPTNVEKICRPTNEEKMGRLLMYRIWVGLLM